MSWRWQAKAPLGPGLQHAVAVPAELEEKGGLHTPLVTYGTFLLCILRETRSSAVT